MMIHRQLIGLWAVLLLTPSAWAQEAGEEIIARFKQALQSRRQAIKNCKIEVEMALRYDPDAPNHDEKVKQFYRKNPLLNSQFTFALDRANGQMRIVQKGDHVTNFAGGQVEKVQTYAEYGYVDGIPIAYRPLKANDYLNEANRQGSICTPDRQSVVAEAAPILAPFYMIVGMYPFPSMLNYPEERYLPVNEIISPDIEKIRIEYAGEVEVNNKKYYRLLHFINNHRHNYYEYLLDTKDILLMNKMSYVYQYTTYSVYNVQAVARVDNITMPMKWRRQMYSDKNVISDALCHAVAISCNKHENEKAAKMQIHKADTFTKTDPNTVHKEYRIQASKITEVSGESSWIIYTALAMVGIGLVVAMLVAKRMKAASGTAS